MTHICYEFLQLITKNILSHLENISGILFDPKLKIEAVLWKKLVENFLNESMAWYN